MQLTVALWGAKGNMGKRYTAVFDALGDNVIPIDVSLCDDMEQNLKATLNANCVLVATPTETHEEILTELLRVGKPVLCEKPLIKDVEKTEAILLKYKQAGIPLRMVNQYHYMMGMQCGGPTYYDYFNHGKDGLAWDCINILGLATGQTALKETSYFWNVAINGERMTPQMVDHSYYDMLHAWRKTMHTNMDQYIIRATRKAAEYEAKLCGR